MTLELFSSARTRIRPQVAAFTALAGVRTLAALAGLLAPTASGKA